MAAIFKTLLIKSKLSLKKVILAYLLGLLQMSKSWRCLNFNKHICIFHDYVLSPL